MARRTAHVPVNDFQRWFEAALTRRGIGLRELADKVETDYSHLWKIVRGNQDKYATSKRPGYELTVRIGEVLNDVEGALVAAKFKDNEDSPRVERQGDKLIVAGTPYTVINPDGKPEDVVLTQDDLYVILALHDRRLRAKGEKGGD